MRGAVARTLVTVNKVNRDSGPMEEVKMRTDEGYQMELELEQQMKEDEKEYRIFETIEELIEYESSQRTDTGTV